MLKSFKYRIYHTEEQKILLNKHLGAVRFIYNKSLEKKIEAYKNGLKLTDRYWTCPE
jgi:putative transposase